MKTKTILFLLLVATAFKSYAQTNTFKITGHIKSIADGEVITLSKSMSNNDGKVYMRFLTDTIQNGRFMFESTTDSLQKLILSTEGERFPSSFLSIWVMPGSTTEIVGKNYYVRTWEIKSTVEEQREEEKYRAIAFKNAAAQDSLSIIYKNLRSQRDSLNDRKEKETIIKKLALIRDKEDSLNLIQDSILYDFMEKTPVSQIWLKTLKHYSMNIIFNKNYQYSSALKGLYERLTSEQKQSETGQVVYRNLFPLPIIEERQAMANGTLYDVENAKKEITQYKGKYILLDFWSIGCGPCIKAFDEMKEIHEQYKNKLTIISISLDDKETWEKGMEWHTLPWINLNDFNGMSGYAARYGVRATPFYVLISPDGTVEKMWSGYGKGSLKEKLKGI